MLSDAPDVAEAVAMAWEKIGIKVKRHEEPWGTFVSKLRKRNTGGVTMVYNGRYYEDPIIVWNRTILSTGPFYFVAETPEYDEMLKEIYNEFDASKRAQLTRQFGQRLHDDVRVVKIAWKSNCFALSNKIASWGTRYGAPYANNYEYITMSGQ